MAEIIENPFGEMWKDFDMDTFKEDICSIIDDIAANPTDNEEVGGLLQELDETIMEFVMMMRFKDAETIEVVKVSKLPDDLIEHLGIPEIDKVDGWVPKDLIPKDQLKRIPGEEDTSVQKPKHKKDTGKKNDWLR